MDSVFRTRNHSYPATHRTVRGYTGAGLMSFTAHVHPNVPQDDEVFLYGVKRVSGGAGMVSGGGAVVYHRRSSRKIDWSRIVPGKFASFRVFFMLILHPQRNYKHVFLPYFLS